MPINDPVRRGKVAPASLAFEGRRTGATYSTTTGDTGNTTYQTFVTNNFRINQNITINARQAEATTRAIMTSMSNAEHRAKHYASDWHYAFEWDTNSDSLGWTANGTTLGALNFLKFSNEVIRTVQGEVVSNAWAFKPSDEATGVWLVSAFVAMRFSPNDKIAETRLVLLKNGSIYRNIDLFNNHYNDKSHVEEVVMQGTALIPLAYGDAVSIGVYLKDQSGTGSGTLSGEANYYGYVSGARVRCTSETINAAVAGNNFDNTV